MMHTYTYFLMRWLDIRVHAWWRHQLETFSALMAICAGNHRTRNKRLSKQWWCWWFETPSCPLWRHRNGIGLTLREMTFWFHQTKNNNPQRLIFSNVSDAVFKILVEFTYHMHMEVHGCTSSSAVILLSFINCGFNTLERGDAYML